MDDQQVLHLTKKYIVESILGQHIQFPHIVLYNSWYPKQTINKKKWGNPKIKNLTEIIKEAVMRL